MRRVLPAVLLVVAACAAQPPERSPLPDVSEVLPQLEGCQLNVGEPLGVTVTSIIEGSAATGLLEAGDVITAIGDSATPDRPELSDVMTNQSPGETTTITYLRDGQPGTVEITFGQNENDPSRAMIGVNVQTAYESVGLADANDVVGPSETARLVELAGNLYVFDPLDSVWQQTGIAPPTETRWVATSAGVYSVNADDPAKIIDLIGGETVPDDGFNGWAPRRLLGTLGDHLLVFVTAEIPDQPGFVNVGIAAFDPLLGETKWVSPIGNSFGVPVAAFGAPNNDSFIAVGADIDSGEQTSVLFFDAAGTPNTENELGQLGEMIGWFDQQSLAFRSSDDAVSVLNLVDGTTTSFELPTNLAGAVAATVGDGQHIIAVDGRNMVLQDLEDTNNARPLMNNCSIGRTSDPGWGV